VENSGWELLSETFPSKDGVEGTEADHPWDRTVSVLKVLTVAAYLVVKTDTAHCSHHADDLVDGRRHLHDYRHIASICPEINRHDMPPNSPDLDNRSHCMVDAGKDLDA
jgi:hypothetical protein